MRRWLPFASVFIAVVSCGRPPRQRAENEILFTLTQTAASADARWQFLTLDDDGQVQDRWDDECYFEPLDERRGELRVEDGVATWKTPLIAHGGIVLRADEPNAHVDRRAWNTGDAISFDAHGFAMPEPKPLKFAAPPAELDVIAPIAGEIAVGAELDVLWRPPSGESLAPGTHVVVQLDSDSDDRIICFFDADGGQGSIPSGLVDVLRARSRSKSGTLKIGTHRQVNVPGPDRWYIYVVASHIARSQPFRLN